MKKLSKVPLSSILLGIADQNGVLLSKSILDRAADLLPSNINKYKYSGGILTISNNQSKVLDILLDLKHRHATSKIADIQNKTHTLKELQEKEKTLYAIAKILLAEHYKDYISCFNPENKIRACILLTKYYLNITRE